MQKDVKTTILYSATGSSTGGTLGGTSVNLNDTQNYADIGVRNFKITVAYNMASGSPSGSFFIEQSSASAGTYSTVPTDDSTYSGSVVWTSGGKAGTTEVDAYISLPWVRVTGTTTGSPIPLIVLAKATVRSV